VIYKQLDDYRNGKRSWGVMAAMAQAAIRSGTRPTLQPISPPRRAGLPALTGERVPEVGAQLVGKRSGEGGWYLPAIRNAEFRPVPPVMAPAVFKDRRAGRCRDKHARLRPKRPALPPSPQGSRQK